MLVLENLNTCRSILVDASASIWWLDALHGRSIMIRTIKCYLLLLLVVGLAGCPAGADPPALVPAADGGAGDDMGGGSDAPGNDAGTPDAQQDAQSDVGQLGVFGDPCTSDGDCVSDHCIDVGDGQVCTRECFGADGCPEERWVCRPVQDSVAGPDPLFLCVPQEDRLCQPCESQGDCGSDGDRCITVGEGDFCGQFCMDSDDCPSDYECTSIEGEETQQCYPRTGSCLCDEETLGSHRTCRVSNDFGTCFGQEICDGDAGWINCDATMPTGEVCDGFDNDCDGAVDEDVEASGMGICPPAGVCLGIPARCEQGEIGRAHV
jgi:hypothetical protein